MSSLIVFHQSSPATPHKLLTHTDDIANTLAPAGVIFSEQALQGPVTAGAPESELLPVVQAQLEQLKATYSMASVQLLSVCDERYEGSPVADTLRVAQRCESRQLWYGLAGRGQLMLHIGEHLYGITLEKQGLVVVPAGATFWFDAGEQPRFALARLFEGEQLPDFETLETDLVERCIRFDQY